MNYSLSNHAQKRMAQRGISAQIIEMVVHYGRRLHIRKAQVFFFGEKELSYCQKHWPDGNPDGLSWRDLKNVVVVVSQNTIKTTYRNRTPCLHEFR